jgi:hypothetical protein
MENNSYVYVHLNKKTKQIFYIGIGTGNNFDRSKSVYNRNKIWKNYVKKYNGFLVQIIYQKISRKEACEIEMNFIKENGRIIDKSGCLTNISFGGEKTFYGLIRTKEHNDKIRKANIGQKRTAETKEKQRLLKLGKKHSETHRKNQSESGKRKIFSDEHRKNLSKSIKGNKNCLGRKLSMESINKIAQSNSKKIICLNNNKVYNSAKEAALELNISDKHIGSVCSGNRNSTHRYKFKHY